MVELEGLLGGDDLVVDGLPDGLGEGAGGQDDVLAGDRLTVNLDGGGGDQLAPSGDEVDPARGDQALQALVHLGDDAVLVSADGGHVDAVQLGLDAQGPSLTDGIGRLSGVQDGLGGNAPAVEAGAADLVSLDEGDLETQLGPAQCCGVAARASAQDDHVVDGVCHENSPQFCPSPSRGPARCTLFHLRGSRTH